jgi:hypothetical protein
MSLAEAVRLRLPSDAVVLELGARDGAVSAAVLEVLGAPERHLAVDPDERSAGGGFRGAVARVPLWLHDCEENSYTTAEGRGAPVACETLEALEARAGLRFDALVAECEGALGRFFDEFAGRLRSFRAVLFVRDRPQLCDYARIEAALRRWGLRPRPAAGCDAWLSSEVDELLRLDGLADVHDGAEHGAAGVGVRLVEAPAHELEAHGVLVPLEQQLQDGAGGHVAERAQERRAAEEAHGQ